MSLRRRAALRTALVMVLAVVAVLVVAREVADRTLVAAVDEDLRTLAEVAPMALERPADAPGMPGRGRSLNELRDQQPHAARRAHALLGVDGPLQVLGPDAAVRSASEGLVLPVTPDAAAVARGTSPSSLETVEMDGAPVRILTVPLAAGGAVQLARSLAEIEAALATLTARLLVIGAALTVLAAGAAVAVADRLVRPVGTLTHAAEEVARTQQLDLRIAPEGDDELARLGRAFDHMLLRLEAARTAQTQLIADASHELRTPLTSLRTNIDLLRSGATLDPDDHQALLHDLGEQLTGVGRLVDDLVVLARGDAAPPPRRTIHLDELVTTVVADRRRAHPAARVELTTEPATLTGDPTGLTRAVGNLVDNAVIHGRDPVEVAVRRRGSDVEVVVTDHGDGIAPADRTRVLERFHRGPEAGGRPGSGLGLAIVAQVARSHGGDVEVSGAREGGARVTLRIPVRDDGRETR